MTRKECEEIIKQHLFNIRDAFMDYYPAGETLSLTVTPHSVFASAFEGETVPDSGYLVDFYINFDLTEGEDETT
jgi:hypothetical protein